MFYERHCDCCSDLDSPNDFGGRNLGRRYSLIGDQNEVVATGGFTDLSEGVCELKKFYLDPSLRGKGIGKKLLLEIIERAKKTGFHLMVLQTDSRMNDAIGLYEKLGFQRLENKRQNEGAVYFSKPLEP